MVNNSKPSDLGWPESIEEKPTTGKPSDLGWPNK